MYLLPVILSAADRRSSSAEENIDVVGRTVFGTMREEGDEDTVDFDQEPALFDDVGGPGPWRSLLERI